MRKLIGVICVTLGVVCLLGSVGFCYYSQTPDILTAERELVPEGGVMMDQVAIGARIKAARERVHLTQEQLAEIVDISPTHMSVIERGVKTPKLDTFIRIANALGVSADALLQDGVEHANDSIMAELSVRIGRLPQKEQNRILNAIRALTE